MNLTIDSLVRIAAAGGGLVIDCTKFTTDSLVRIAAASTNKGSKIIMTNVEKQMVTSLVRIAAAGNGNVIFDVR